MILIIISQHYSTIIIDDRIITGNQMNVCRYDEMEIDMGRTDLKL